MRLSRALSGLIRSMRPRQWVKNVLVLGAPFAGGVIVQWPVLIAVGIAFVAFSLAASGVSLLASPNPVLVTGIYIAVQLCYCWWLKHQPVVDISIIASGFLLRAIAGGAAAGIALSQWFLLTTAFGSLFMVAGKRYAEIHLTERTGAKIRKSLERYTSSYLRFVWTLSATGVIMTYGLWAFQLSQINQSHWPVISLVPFVIAVLRYAVDVDAGNGTEPEEIALGDRVLQVLGGCLVLTLIAAVYL